MLLVIFSLLFSGFIFFSSNTPLFTRGKAKIPDVPDYWPDLGGDLTKVIWSHATNSIEKLEQALAGETMMLEADVSLGTLFDHPESEPFPIMAHPPDTTSDLSLKMFLDAVVQTTSTGVVKKGIKLDFKSIEVVEPSLKILQEEGMKIKFPLWLNADILEGPHNSNQEPRKPVDADQFLTICVKYFPDATLSPGFTTGVSTDPEERRYTEAHVENMFQVLSKNHSIGKKITFPVRAILVGNSLETLTWLLDQTSTRDVLSTLTIWGSDEMTSAEKLRLKEVVSTIGKDRIYWDVSFPLEQIFP